MRVRVATYNVHRCVGLDGRHDPDRILEVLRELDADVIALQELEWDPMEALHVLDVFAHELKATGIPGPTLLRGSGHYGNSVLTRLPAHEVRLVDLSVPRREPRGAVDLRLGVSGAELRVIATHLGLRPAERRVQMRRILSLLAGVEPGRRNPSENRDPLVLLGDLNEWFLWGRPLRWLRSHFGNTHAPATFPSRRPVFALDQIWAEPPGICEHVRIHASPLARIASDHLPLCAELVW